MGNNTNTRSFVAHPRYGDKPIPSNQNLSVPEIKSAHWRYGSVSFFPETAIVANVEKQNYATYPRSLYVDIEEVCTVCNRPFLFFALEQKYWFEVLGFYIDAHCTRCFDCRKKDQNVKKMFFIYTALVTKDDRTEAENQQLKQVALELFQLGYIRDREKVDRIR